MVQGGVLVKIFVAAVLVVRRVRILPAAAGRGLVAAVAQLILSLAVAEAVTALWVALTARRAVQAGVPEAFGQLLPAQVAVVALTTVPPLLVGLAVVTAAAVAAVGVLTAPPAMVEAAFLLSDLCNKEYDNGTY